jgi:hypothetical protein
MLGPSILDLVETVITTAGDFRVTKKSDAYITLLGDKAFTPGPGNTI